MNAYNTYISGMRSILPMTEIVSGDFTDFTATDFTADWTGEGWGLLCGDDVRLGPPSKNRHGSTVFALVEPIVVSTPPLLAPFGSAEFRPRHDAPAQSVSVDVQFPNDAAWFEKCMRDVDAKVQAAFASVHDDDLEYRPLVRSVGGGKYPPLMKIKLTADAPTVPPGSKICVDMYIDHVWVLNGRFGVTWRALHVDIV